MDAEKALAAFEPSKYDPAKNSLTLKGFTAVLPDDKVQGSDTKGLFMWLRGAGDVFWHVKLANSGQLNVAMNVANEEAHAGAEIEVEISGQKVSAVTPSTGGPDKFVPVNMGSVTIQSPGTIPVAVRAKSIKGGTAGNLLSLELSGPAAVGSEEERIPRDISPTILQMKEGVEYEMVYNSVTPTVSYMGTNFVVCGVGSLALCDTDPDGEKCVTFSGADDEKFVFPWKLNETYHFLAKAVLSSDKQSVDMFAYLYNNEESKWKLVGNQKGEGTKLLEGPSSQIYQSYGTQQGYYPREALYGPMWVRVPGGEWEELSDAKFVYVKYSAENGNATVEDSRFRIRSGGDTKMDTQPGTLLSAKKTGQIPDILKDIESKL